MLRCEELATMSKIHILTKNGAVILDPKHGMVDVNGLR